MAPTTTVLMFISHSSEAGKSKIKVLTDSISGENIFPALQRAFLYCVFKWRRDERESRGD
jgi:hypothetical protein